jgi:hypothetical protein
MVLGDPSGAARWAGANAAQGSTVMIEINHRTWHFGWDSGVELEDAPAFLAVFTQE